MDFQTIVNDVLGFIQSLVEEIKAFLDSIVITKNFENEEYLPN